MQLSISTPFLPSFLASYRNPPRTIKLCNSGVTWNGHWDYATPKWGLSYIQLYPQKYPVISANITKMMINMINWYTMWFRSIIFVQANPKLCFLHVMGEETIWWLGQRCCKHSIPRKFTIYNGKWCLADGSSWGVPFSDRPYRPYRSYRSRCTNINHPTATWQSCHSLPDTTP